MIWLAVAIGAAVGSPSRFLLDSALSHRLGRAQPWGTFAVNMSGSLLLGILAGLLSRRDLSAFTYALFGTGLCGSFTTFSTFIWETIALVEARRAHVAAMNVILTVGLGVGLAYGAFVLSGPRHW